MSVQNSFEQLISLAIKREEEAFDFYMHFATNAALSSSAKLLKELADQEVEHKKKLKEALGEGVCDTFTCTTVSEVEQLDLSKYLVDIPLEPSSSPQEILVVAIKRENSAISFYNALSELTQNAAHRTVFDTLAKEEKKHKDILQGIYDDIFQPDN